MDFVDLAQKLDRIGKAEGGKMFMGKPDRWWEEGPRWRCINEHVSKVYLKSEAKGGACCLACGEFVLLTFPEDEDGPLTNGTTPGKTEADADRDGQPGVDDVHQADSR